MARVLVVDDVAVNRELVVTLLRYAGHELAEAGNGEEALVQVRTFRPHLVVCDILMPKMDGYEFVRHLRNDPEIAHTEIVFYTATFLEQEAHVLARACGVRHVMTKPCEPEEILATVTAALEQEQTEAPPVLAAPEFDRDHLRLVTDKLAQKAEQLEEANERLEGLIDLGVQLTSERQATVLFEQFCDRVRSLFGARLGLLWLSEQAEQGEQQCFASGDETEQIALLNLRSALVSNSSSGAAQRFDRCSGDAELRSLVSQHIPTARCALLAPLISTHNRYGGILLIDKLGSSSFSDHDQRSLTVQAAHVGRIYENGKLFAQVQTQVAMLQAQAEAREREAALLRLEHNVARALASAEALNDGLSTVLQAVCESQHWDLGRLWQVDDDAGVLRLTMEWPASARADAQAACTDKTVLAPGEGLAGRVWRTGEALWIPDLRAEPRLINRALLLRNEEASATLFPLFSSNRVFGVLSFLGRGRSEPDERIRASARVIGNQLGQFIQRRRAEDAVKASEHFVRSTLDSLLEHVCVIDSSGFILAVNRAWREFAQAEAPNPLRVVEGANYLETCATARGDGANEARAMAAGIRDVIDGVESTFTMEYTCDSPTVEKWFVARASRFAGTGAIRVVVAHENITERKQAEQRIQRLLRVSNVMSDINALIVRAQGRDELFKGACRIATETGQFKMAWLAVLHPEPLRIEILAGMHDGTATEYFEQLGTELQNHLKRNTPQLEKLIARQQPVVINDIAASPWMTLSAASLDAGARSAIALPLVVGRETRGLVALYASEIDFFDADEIKLLEELAGDLAFAMEHLRQADQLNHLAYYDVLTGHANQMLFNERVAQFVDAASADDTRLAIAILDIDRFKSINDMWGRHTGDDLLRQIGQRIVTALGDRSRLARVGPDQFGVVIQNAPRGIELSRTLEELYKACFDAVFDCGTVPIHVTGRMGVALYPDDGVNAEALFRNAEAAVKRAKHSAEHILLYDPQVSKEIANKIALEMRLRDALDRKRFVLHYQPKVDAKNRHIVGAEALIRWQDPELGLVPPYKFIPLMEETGLIVEVGLWALRQAAEDRRRWMTLGLAAPSVAVNVSVVQLRKMDFVERVLEALKDPSGNCGIDLEITESAAMDNVEDTIAKLRRLRQSGVSLAIDDFGTGYSSLAYLSKLPAQVLKIDRAFTSVMNSDPNAMTLVSTIISLAHALKMEVVAEGVETEEQADTLRRLHCDQLQGYLISKPLTESQFSEWLQGVLT